MKNSDKVILHLCAEEGSDSQEYADNGYDRRIIGIDIDVRTYKPPENVYGIVSEGTLSKFAPN